MRWFCILILTKRKNNGTVDTTCSNATVAASATELNLGGYVIVDSRKVHAMAIDFDTSGSHG